MTGWPRGLRRRLRQARERPRQKVRHFPSAFRRREIRPALQGQPNQGLNNGPTTILPRRLHAVGDGRSNLGISRLSWLRHGRKQPKNGRVSRHNRYNGSSEWPPPPPQFPAVSTRRSPSRDSERFIKTNQVSSTTAHRVGAAPGIFRSLRAVPKRSVLAVGGTSQWRNRHCKETAVGVEL